MRLTPAQRTILLDLEIGRQPGKDRRLAVPIRELLAKGLVAWTGKALAVTDAGLAWIAEARARVVAANEKERARFAKYLDNRGA